jgi:outer membrane protein assembly factor BamB
MRPKFISAILTFVFFSGSIMSCFGQGGSQDLLWKYKTKGKIIGSAAVKDSVIYFGSTDGTIHALNEKNGNQIWQFKTGGTIASKPEVKDRRLYILSGDGYFYTLDTQSGTPLWRFRTGGEHRFIRQTSNGIKYNDIWDYYLSGAVVLNGRVYFGSSDGNIYSLDAKSGTLLWKYKTGNVVHATPVIKDKWLFVGSFDGYFYALNALNGKLIWKFNTIGDRYFPLGAVQKGASIYNGAVYFGSRDFNLYALDVKDGHGHWNYKEQGSWIIATPTIYKGNIYYGTSDSHAFYSKNAKNGTLNWKLPLNMRVYGSAAANGDRIYFGCFNGFLYGVDSNNGKIAWRFQTDGSRKKYHTIYNDDGTFRPDFSIYGKTLKKTQENEVQIQSMGSIMSTPAIQNQTIFFGSTDSTFYAVKLPEK